MLLEQNASVENGDQVQFPVLQKNSGWLACSSFGAPAADASMPIWSFGSGMYSEIQGSPMHLPRACFGLDCWKCPRRSRDLPLSRVEETGVNSCSFELE